MVLERIGVLSVAKVFGILYAVLGLIVGGLFSLFSILGAAVAASEGGEGGLAMLIGAGAVIVAPIFYGVLGAIFGAIGAGIYNLIAMTVGGIELELAER
jgi:hypothetical protein